MRRDPRVDRQHGVKGGAHFPFLRDVASSASNPKAINDRATVAMGRWIPTPPRADATASILASRSGGKVNLIE